MFDNYLELKNLGQARVFVRDGTIIYAITEPERVIPEQITEHALPSKQELAETVGELLAQQKERRDEAIAAAASLQALKNDILALL